MFGLTPFCGAPFCGLGVDLEEVAQSLTFSQTATPVLQLTTLSALVFTQTLTAQSVSQYPITDSFTLTDSHILNYSQLIELLQSLSFVDSAFYYDQITINDALSFIQDNTFAFGLSATQNFTLAQSAAVNNVLSNTSEQVITFIHTGVLNFIYNLELCGCLVLDQRAGEYIALSVTQSLIFLLTEIMGVEQTIEFLSEIDTNFDSSCCGDIYGVPDRLLANEVSMTQAIVVGGVYGQTITQSLTPLSTAMWRT